MTKRLVRGRPAVAGGFPRRRRVGRLIALAAVSVLGPSAIVFAVAAHDHPSPAAAPAVSPAANDPARFAVAGVVPGMTLSEVKLIRPDLVVADPGNDAIAASFAAEGALHSVWFVDADAARRAFRIRSERTFDARGADDVLAQFARFREPIASSCGRQVFAPGSRCHFRWLTAGGVVLDVLTRVVKDGAGIPRTTLTVIATDGRLAAKAGPAKGGEPARLAAGETAGNPSRL